MLGVALTVCVLFDTDNPRAREEMLSWMCENNREQYKRKELEGTGFSCCCHWLGFGMCSLTTCVDADLYYDQGFDAMPSLNFNYNNYLSKAKKASVHTMGTAVMKAYVFNATS